MAFVDDLGYLSIDDQVLGGSMMLQPLHMATQTCCGPAQPSGLTLGRRLMPGHFRGSFEARRWTSVTNVAPSLVVSQKFTCHSLEF
jgi:hypothetical protein